MTEASLKEKTAKGLFWGGIGNGAMQLLNLVFGIFLARLLSTTDHGGRIDHLLRHGRNFLGEWLHPGTCQ